jgi:glucose/arabinose dehydrogenase
MRTGRLIAICVALTAGCMLLVGVVAPRVRARTRSDWFESRNLTLAPVVRGLTEPTYVVGPPDGTNRLFVLERAGLVRVADAEGKLRSVPFLDLSGRVSLGNEEGLLGLAFHPAFSTNGYLYVMYTANDSSLRVIRYTVAPEHPDSVDPSTAQVVLSLAKSSKYHNGGMLAFGPDGYLYVSIGDDEGSEKAQELGNLFGKILRLDVQSATPYAIPASNPFADQPGARGEIWAYGLRNPWRFSFDRATGDLWIADVGDADVEEVDFQPAGSAGGENYGWPYLEGDRCNDPEHCNDAGLVAPLVTYGHTMNCAVMGGYVYRGARVPALQGKYLYGDLCTGGVFTVASGVDPSKARLELGYQPIKISSFGEDPAGDVYVVDLQGGTIYRIEAGSLPSAGR